MNMTSRTSRVFGIIGLAIVSLLISVCMTAVGSPDPSLVDMVTSSFIIFLVFCVVTGLFTKGGTGAS
jgi:hypothetical protein